MKHKTETYTTPDGFHLHTASWLPEGQPRSVVVIVHGIAEHSSRYAHVAEAMVERGYAVYAHDHRGHGQSDGERTYFDINQLVDDLKLRVDAIRAEHPGVPLFLFGHSMGSLISLLFALRYQDVLAGLISSGTPIALGELSPAIFSVFRVLDKVVPKLRIVKIDASLVVRDPVAAKAYDTDPLIDRGATRVHSALEIAEGGRTVLKEMGNLRLPALILQGEGDKIVPSHGSRLLYEGISSQDKTFKLYPGLYHEICNEAERGEVIADILAWLDAHTS